METDEIIRKLADPGLRAKVEWLLSEPTVGACSPLALADVVRPMLAYRETEALVVIALDQQTRVIEAAILSEGSHRLTVVDSIQVLRWVLTRNRPASRFAMAHCHPSGSTMPSAQDDEVTKAVRKAADAVGLPLIDHLIVGSGAIYSYAEHGWARTW